MSDGAGRSIFCRNVFVLSLMGTGSLRGVASFGGRSCRFFEGGSIGSVELLEGCIWKVLPSPFFIMIV